MIFCSHDSFLKKFISYGNKFSLCALASCCLHFASLPMGMTIAFDAYDFCNRPQHLIFIMLNLLNLLSYWFFPNYRKTYTSLYACMLMARKKASMSCFNAVCTFSFGSFICLSGIYFINAIWNQNSFWNYLLASMIK